MSTKRTNIFSRKRTAEPVIRTCIVWTLLCAVLLMGMCQKADSHLLYPEESGILLRFAADAGRQDYIWAREAMGQRVEMVRPELGGRSAAGRYVKTAEIFCLDSSAFLPKIFNSSRRMYYAAKEDAAKSRLYIIVFMHDLDGRKRITI